MVIGEAATQVSPETRERYSDIPWKKIVGMRNRLIHGYDRIDFDRVWDAVANGIPQLIAALDENNP